MFLPTFFNRPVGNRHSVRSYLIALVVFILLPIFPLGWWLATGIGASERAAIGRHAGQEARGLTALIDRQVENAQSILTALATSTHLQNDNFEEFNRQAVEVARRLKTEIVLRDVFQDVQVVNTAVPWGSGLRGGPPERQEAGQDVLRTKQPVISDVFLGRTINKHFVSVVVPVIQEGEVKYTLSIGIPTEQFAQIIRDTQLPDHWAVSVVDRRGVIVTRSEGHDEFTGTRVRNDFLSNAAESGVGRGVNREGVEYQWTYRRSAVTGWYTAVGIPESVLTAPLMRALSFYSLAGALLLMIAVAIAYRVSGHLSQSFGALGIDRKPTREEFRVLFEGAPHGVVVADHHGHIVLANERLERKFGYAAGELIGRPVEVLLPTHHRGAGLTPANHGLDVSASFGLRRDGSEFPIDIRLNPITTPNGYFVMAVVIDMTARKKSEAMLSAVLEERDGLRRRLMQAQEDERLRLAHELHDETGQNLAAVMLGLKSLEPHVDQVGREQVHLLGQHLTRMGEALHRVAWELRPSSIDELGLESTLANYIEDWNSKFGIEIDFQCAAGDLDSLTNEIRTTIYRVVQEALTNIAKHARTATAVSVVIHQSGAMLQVTIEDNGTGFAADGLSLSSLGRTYGPLGLAGMKERLTLIGGTLNIESSLGDGATLFARIPLGMEKLAA